HDKGQYDRAIQDFDEAISLRSQRPLYFSNRAAAYAAKGETTRAKQDEDQALIESTAALSINPRNADALYIRGIVRRRRGDTAGGDADIDAARAINDNTVRRLLRYGVR